MTGSVRKTILQFSSSSGPGGAERLVSKLAAALNQNNHFRSVVCMFRPGWLLEQCREYSIVSEVLPSNGLWDLSWLRGLLKLIRKENVSLIHAHEFDAITQGAMVAWLTGIPIVATIHGKNYYYEKARRRFAFRLVSRYARMVAVSKDLKEFVADRVGIESSKIQVIYNGVDPLSQVAIHEQARCRFGIGLGEEDQVVGSIGSLYPIKGHRYLIDAVPSIVQSCPRARFILIGRGDQELLLKEQVRRLGIEDCVRFLGLRRDISELLSIMDIFVLPSLSEGLSVATLEAMAAGRPVVATRVGGNPELVQDGVTGILVPSENSEGLAQCIIALLRDGGTAKIMGQRGLQRVQQNFAMSSMIDNYRALYDQCLCE